MIDFQPWTRATESLLPGQQRVFHDFLSLVAEGKAHLVYGANYRNGKPCLVNGTAQMLSTSAISPSNTFPEVVMNFDNLCRLMEVEGLNKGTEGYVSPLMADCLLHAFAPLKELHFDEQDKVDAEIHDAPYIEPSDAAMQSFLSTMSAPAPEDIVDADKAATDPAVDYTRSFVNVKFDA